MVHRRHFRSLVFAELPTRCALCAARAHGCERVPAVSRLQHTAGTATIRYPSDCRCRSGHRPSCPVEGRGVRPKRHSHSCRMTSNRSRRAQQARRRFAQNGRSAAQQLSPRLAVTRYRSSRPPRTISDPGLASRTMKPGLVLHSGWGSIATGMWRICDSHSAVRQHVRANRPRASGGRFAAISFSIPSSRPSKPGQTGHVASS
jgi:hypothetical protein